MLHLHQLPDPTGATDPRLARMCALAARCLTRRPELRVRTERALILAAAGDVHPHPIEPRVFLVSSRRPGFCHRVSTDVCTCTCPDFAAQVRRPGPHKPACKHLIAAFLVDLAARPHAA